VTGFNLPPGCSVNDIPGNRPEDVEQEILMTEFYKALSVDEVSLINELTSEGFKSTRLDLENIIWKAIEFGRRIANQQDQPEDYEDYSKSLVCCCCTGYDTEDKKVVTNEPKILYKCSKPSCKCYTCEEHRQSCGYCLGCCVEDHEDSDHSVKGK
jgi:hypothetical protein